MFATEFHSDEELFCVTCAKHGKVKIVEFPSFGRLLLSEQGRHLIFDVQLQSTCGVRREYCMSCSDYLCV